MKLSFRAVKGCDKKKQGLIYYAMLNKRFIKDEVLRVCEEALDEVCKSDYDRQMMQRFVETDDSTEKVALDYFCSSRKIQVLFKKYITLAVAKLTRK